MEKPVFVELTKKELRLLYTLAALESAKYRNFLQQNSISKNELKCKTYSDLSEICWKLCQYF